MECGWYNNWHGGLWLWFNQIVRILVLIGIGFLIYRILKINQGNRWKRSFVGQTGAEKCPKCGAPVESAYLRCPECHYKLKANCPSCGKIVKTTWKICPYCDKELYKENVKTQKKE